MTEQMQDADEPFEVAFYFPNWFGFAAAKKPEFEYCWTEFPETTSFPHTPIWPRWCVPSMEYPSQRVVIRLERVWRLPLVDSEELRFGSGDASGIWAWRWLRGRKPPLYPEDSCISPDFAFRMGIPERLELQRRNLWKAAQNIGRLHFWSFTNGGLPFFFEQSGRFAATMGIETRHPFSDRRVIEFFLSLPLNMKTYSPLPKRVIRAGMNGVLPEKVRPARSLPIPAEPS